MAINVWNIEDDEDSFKVAKQGIEALRNFYRKIELVYTLRDLGIYEEKHFLEMAKKAYKQVKDGYIPLSVDEIVEIYKESL